MVSPKVTLTTQQGNSNVAPLGEASTIPRDRFVLRQAFPTTSRFEGKVVLTNRWAQTPFRIAMNAGDLHSRQAAAGGSNQIKGAVGRFHQILFSDSVHKGTGASGNQHFVYDSSDYTRYKQLAAKNKNYNDPSFGGSNNGAYVFIMRGLR
jgi:hypothetical protein